MLKGLSFSVAILALTMACSRGSSPTAPTAVTPPPVQAAPPPAAAKIVSITITSSRGDALSVNQTSVMHSIANYDDGTSAPITAAWTWIGSGVVTMLQNGPVLLVTGQKVGSANFKADAAGFTATLPLTVNPAF